MSVMKVATTGGVGGIAYADISAVLPDVTNPQQRSVVYTTVFTEGLGVEGVAADLCVGWYNWLESADETEGDDCE